MSAFLMNDLEKEDFDDLSIDNDINANRTHPHSRYKCKSLSNKIKLNGTERLSYDARIVDSHQDKMKHRERKREGVKSSAHTRQATTFDQGQSKNKRNDATIGVDRYALT